MTQTVWIIRHGERQDMIDRTWSETAEDPYNPPLSDAGRRQAEEVARRLEHEGLHHVIASPFHRTLETATPTAELLNLQIKVEMGACENLRSQWYPHDPRTWSLDDLAARFPRVDRNYKPLGCANYPEDWEQCKARGARTMRQIVAAYPNDNMLLVAHGASTSALAWGLVTGYPQFTGKTCSLIKIVRHGDRWNLELAGDTSHLSHVDQEVRFN